MCPVQVVAIYALQSAEYIPFSDWVCKHDKVDLHEAQALWRAARNPKLITLANSDHIFFDGYYRPRSRERYFVTPVAESGINSSMCTSDGREDGVAYEEPCVTPRKRRSSPYENVQRVLSQRTAPNQSGRINGCQPNFLEMTETAEDHYIRFTEDRRPSSASSGDAVLLCPDTLDEMLQIVSNVRLYRMDVLHDHQVEAARSYVAAQSEDKVVNLEGSMFPSIPASTLHLLPRRG